MGSETNGWHPAEPTAEQCSAGSVVSFQQGDFFACWYPQMGGYVAKAVIAPHPDGCFDAWVWHDGEFPFGDGRSPVRLHHCEVAQFRAFADDVEAGLRRL